LVYLLNYKVSDPSLLMPSIVTITPVKSARNLGVISDSTLSMSDHISSVSKSCFLSIRDLRRIRNTLDFSTARTIATSLIHSRLDNCNSLFLNLPRSQTGRLQLILNSSARAVSKTPKYAHISPQPYQCSIEQYFSLLWHHHSATSLSSLKVTNRSFTDHATVLWNSLPKQLRQPLTPPSLVAATDSTPPLALSSHQFHSKLKTFLFEQSFPP